MGPAVIIRADASPRIGTGHVMRCLALAAAAIKQGWRVRWVGCIESDELRSRLKDQGIDLMPLIKPHPDPSDLEKTLNLLAVGIEGIDRPSQTPWLVLDGYQFDATYQGAVRDARNNLLVVDDYNHLDRYNCDILLNQNIGADRLGYKTAADTMRLLGPRFALLRPEFLVWKNRKQVVPEKARHILVTMGGADPHNTTAKILEGLVLMNDPEIEVKIVVGPANPHLLEIQQAMDRAPFPGDVLHGVRDIASVMAWADVTLTAASVTSLELAYMGVPMLAVVLAENQKGLAAGLVESGVAVLLGSCENLISQKIHVETARVLADRSRRQAMSDVGRTLVDGRGADRIMAVLGRDFLRIREARPLDCRRLWELANDPVARTHSFSTDPIPWEDHQTWFNARLSDPESCIYLAELPGGELVGTLRFQSAADHAVVSVTIDEGFRGLGFGAEVIRSGCLKYRESNPDLPIRALIKPGNPASEHAFAKAGFKPDGEANNAGVRTLVMTYAVEG